jgi:hypothetical protein
MLYIVKKALMFIKYHIGRYKMISFQSENLQYKIYKTDPIDISVHINASKLDHIFKEYLYFTTSEKLSNG